MTYDDRLRISTPEGVDFELTLAGLGSRVLAAVLDAGIRGLTYLALGILLGLLSSGWDIPWLFPAVFLPFVFLVEVGYDITFELLNAGRTPGKQSAGIRVLRACDEPVDLRSSAVRNVLRLIDGPLTIYIAGIIAILTTKKNQRLGDLAAGTVVVRDRIATTQYTPVSYQFGVIDRAANWDLSAVTSNEVATLRTFLERRATLSGDARARLAADLAARLRTKIAGVPAQIHPEAMIEQIVRARSAQQ